ncbi:MAG: hypothetical protein ABI137_15345, partial [Antricoccus sp.]
FEPGEGNEQKVGVRMVRVGGRQGSRIDQVVRSPSGVVRQRMGRCLAESDAIFVSRFSMRLIEAAP